MRYKVVLEYDGHNFSGWQRQKHSSNSIQQILESAIKNFLGEEITTHCGGRTDVGVHALGQVVHFDLQKGHKLYVVRNAINYHLRPLPICVLSVETTNDEFHARFSAKRRHYLYRIVNRYAPLTIDHNRAWQVCQKLDVNKMNKAAKYLIGKHDFSSFRAKDCQAKNPIKTVDNIEVLQDGYNINIAISARSFLHNQVRIITGTLVECGRGRLLPEEISNILRKCKRSAASTTAPPYGLYLVRIDY
ncbi:tRNA pseudouridine(38-40) synthase TruA [Candidatus Mesenet endosymbiont of Agriotes lineatus]|uniref:tRNA pseudouridine(38-40) synthase TruA n=1 Tax=Candidatus Mesenet endosymbiont of Agriotes lineatus TaxID=3077948 RepID=UPI0030CB0A98